MDKLIEELQKGRKVQEKILKELKKMNNAPVETMAEERHSFAMGHSMGYDPGATGPKGPKGDVTIGGGTADMGFLAAAMAKAAKEQDRRRGNSL